MVKLLKGLMFSSILVLGLIPTCHDHLIDYLSGNILKRIGVVKRVKYFLYKKNLRYAFSNAHLIPHFDYASSG